MNGHVGLNSNGAVGPDYAPDVAEAVASLVSQLLRASHIYPVLGFYFDREDVAQADASRFFFDLAHEKREGAERLLRLHSQRGHSSSSIFESMQGPLLQEEWSSSLAALETVLALEEALYHALRDLYVLGVTRQDSLLCAFLEHHFLQPEARLLSTLDSPLTQVRRLPGPWAALQDRMVGRGRPHRGH